MGIKAPIISEIAPGTYAINEFGLSAMFLLIGRKKALLIDTGCGVCDLKRIVRDLTDLPYQVVVTHGHYDHTGGFGSFDKIYMNEKDHDLARSLDVNVVRHFVDLFGKGGCYKLFDYRPEDIREIDSFPELLKISDRECIDLGGRMIEVVEIPGHTPGGTSFLDVDNRIIFSGDSCNVNLLVTGCSVETTLKGIRKFKSLSDRFDRNFNGHFGYFMGTPSCQSQPGTVPDDLIHLCKRVLRKEGNPEEYDFLGHIMNRVSYGSAAMSYYPDRVFD